MVHAHDVAGGVILVVGIVSLALALVAWRATRRSGNRRLLFVTAAFSVFFVKAVLVTWAVWTGGIGHEHLELVSSLFDLATIVLLALPLIR